MLAHHPTTGQPIRILRSDAHIAKTKRVLVWVRSTFQASSKWTSRWSAILTEPSAFSRLTGAPVAMVMKTFSADWIPVLKALDGKDVLLITTRSASKQMASKGLVWDQHLELGDLQDMYPFLYEKLEDDDVDEKIIVSIAHILRFHEIAWHSTLSEKESDAALKYQLRAWNQQIKGTIRTLPEAADAEAVVPQLWLIQQYFKHPLPRRARELWTCLEKNLACDYVDKLLLLNEAMDTELPTHSKLVVKTIGHRLTYADVLRAIQTDLPDGCIAAFSNSDIWLDETLSVLWSIPLEERALFLALLRWEENGALFGPRADSQDTWIVHKNCVRFEVTDEDFGFSFGKPGCDNAIALAMLRKKFLVVNPAYTIKTHHVHSSQIRNYDPHDVLYKPMYLYIDPSAIQVTGVEKNLKAYRDSVPEYIQAQWSQEQQKKESFARPIREIREGQAKTICTMINRNELQAFEPQGRNLYTPPPEKAHLYRFFQPTLVTNEGLLADMQNIFVGPYKEWATGWETAAVSSLTPAIHIPLLVTLHTPDPKCWSDLSEWILQYFVHAFRIRTAIRSAGRRILPDFVVPSVPGISSFLYDCVWNESKITTAPHMENTQFYCNEVWTTSPRPAELTREDIACLRSILAPAVPRRKRRPVCVFCIDEDPAILTKGWVEETIQNIFRTSQQPNWDFRILTSKTDFPAIRSAMQDADWIVGEAANSLLNWMWMASPGTHILEFQPEMGITSRRIHLAGASGLEYVGGLVRKEPIEFQRQHAMLDFGVAMQKYGFKHLLQTELASSDLPVIYLPSGKALEGFWSHSGDTFREIVHIWEERGFCRIQTTEDTPHCWWGGIGEVLLYDRPTPRWWSAHLPTSYQMALFGNCAPPGPAEHLLRQSVWSFWPRAPKALEAAVQQGLPGWSERTLSSLFLGKVENGVQKMRRCGTDWSTAVELFSMPIDSTSAYPYSQEAYLQTLLNSRFGLCLPGYGNKCNREIEYMACGTVPIVTDGVDMKYYLRAPQEGVHYLVAKTPEDVAKVIAAVTQEKWEVMSAACHAWWRENASAEGLFKLTSARIEQCRPYFHVGIPPTL